MEETTKLLAMMSSLNMRKVLLARSPNASGLALFTDVRAKVFSVQKFDLTVSQVA